MSTISGSLPEVSDLAVMGQAAAAMQAQLQRLQQQLAEHMNRANAATPEGRAAIEAIRSRISQVEQRIGGSVEAERREAQLKAGRSEPAASLAASAGSVSQVRAGQGLGSIIDVFA